MGELEQGQELPEERLSWWINNSVLGSKIETEGRSLEEDQAYVKLLVDMIKL